MNYRITWTIDIEADSPQEAAEKARKIQLSEDSAATFFDVQEFKPSKLIEVK